MIFKLKTSQKTMEYFKVIGQSTNLQPFALSKIAIALSIASSKPLSPDDCKTDNNGLELNRQTITADHDMLFKALIIMEEKRFVPDDEYFPKLLKAHLDRGASMLYLEFRYSKNFINHLLKLKSSI